MLAMYLIVVGFFVAILAIGYFAVQQGEEERGGPLEALGPTAPADDHPAACAVCDAPRPAAATTSDQVVFEVEHRIDAELRDIAHALQAHPERLGRIFHG